MTTLAELLGLNRPTPGTLQEMIAEAEDMVLGLKPFSPIPTSAFPEYNRILAELNALDVTEVDTIFVTVLRKAKGGEWCESCQTTHENDGVQQMVLVCGDLSIVQASINSAMREIKARASVAQPDPNGPVMAPSPTSPQ